MTAMFLNIWEYVTKEQTKLMDYRSLTWNYEYGTWIHNSDTVMDIKEDLLDIIEVSREVLYSDWKKSYFLKKVSQSILRIAAPLL